MSTPHLAFNKINCRGRFHTKLQALVKGKHFGEIRKPWSVPRRPLALMSHVLLSSKVAVIRGLKGGASGLLEGPEDEMNC